MCRGTRNSYRTLLKCEYALFAFSERFLELRLASVRLGAHKLCSYKDTYRVDAYHKRTTLLLMAII